MSGRLIQLRARGVLAADLAVLVAVTLAAGPAGAQTRKDVLIQTPGAMRQLGYTRATYGFRAYSYGIGSLQSGYSPHVGVLGSSISGPAAFTIQRGTASIPGASLGQVVPSRGVTTPMRLTTPPAPIPRMSTRVPFSQIIPNNPYSAASAAQSFLKVLGASPGVAPTTQPITSLVPRRADRYAKYMAQAEEALRAGKYSVALGKYRQARDLGGDDAESLLGMALASFADSRYSYASAAFYMREAIQRLPELPLTRLQPRSLFRDDETYQRHVEYLLKHLQEDPRDAEGYLILGVLRWFEADVESARAALRNAARYSKSASLSDAAATFWDGMVASGKVTGQLAAGTTGSEQTRQAATRPAQQQ